MEKIKFSFLIKVWLLLKPFHKDLYAVMIITAIFEVVRMGGPYIFGKILDLLITTKGMLSFEAAIYVVAGLAGVRLISLFIDYSTDIIIARLLWQAEQYISTLSFNKLLELSMDYHEKENTGTKIGLVNKGTDKLIDLLSAFVWEFLRVTLQLIVSLVMIVLVSFKIGLVFGLSLLPFILITFKMFKSTRSLRVARFDAYETSSGEIGDTISNITVVKAFAQEQREKNSFLSLWSYIKNISVQEFKKQIVAGFGRSLFVEIFYIILVVIGILEIRANLLTVGSLVFLINLIERGYSNVYRMGKIYNRAADAAEPVNRISNLMDQQPTVTNCPNPLKPESIYGSIRFKNITFAYRKKQVLKNVSFYIPHGSFTAFVGKSGSGKSTIAKLISRYYDPTSGIVYIDDHFNLKELDLEFYRQHTAVVFQDSPVPNRKVWEVISYADGKKDFSEVREKVYEAAKLAHAHEFIMEFEDGYQTLIGERGVKLSGGQRQRLAIARALFAKPKILIMDEPTSHLDTLSERLIQKALQDMSKERSFTKIIIAHRLSTVRSADQILVMDKGRLVEQGTDIDLTAKNGIYSQIVRQSELRG